MRIGLLGLTFYSGNKGCEALSYAFLELLNKIARVRGETYSVDLITVFPTRLWIRSRLRMNIVRNHYLPLKNYSNLKVGCECFKRINHGYLFTTRIKKYDFVFDFTDGDSFTDIYGEERFYTRTALKQYVIDTGVPFVLGSQTIGPFKDPKVEKVAAKVLREAHAVYARDELSQKYAEKISGCNATLTTDVAFMLPFSPTEPKRNTLSIGFNASGLLWSGGYTRDNQFNLTVDYRMYCRSVIRALLNKGAEVHLILHAYTLDLSRPDNDLIAVKALHKEFPETIVSPQFVTPMEAKSYIAFMDCFIGARMHATIGAYSAGVATIPFSYSRKFEGLYSGIDYPYVIHAQSDSTDVAIQRTLDWIKRHGDLKKAVEEGNKIVEKKTQYLVDSLDRLLYKGRNNI